MGLLSLITLVIFISGCAPFDPKGVFVDAHQTTFDAKGPVAQQQLDLFYVTLWVTIFIFIVVGGALAYATLRYRVRAGEKMDDSVPPQTHGNPVVEIGLIAASVILLVIIAVPTVRGIFTIYTLPEDEDMLVIDVTAYQWWWAFEYPELGVVNGNELAIPVDRKVRFNLRTFDVIHSFWVPKLAGKIDMIPNRNNWLWLEASETGQYWGQCAEFCGESHANMKFRVHVYSEEDFDRWVEHQLSEAREPEENTLAMQGKDLFQQKACLGCHTIQGTMARGVAGPDLTHYGSRMTVAAGMMDNTEENLAEWLRHPDKVKPGNLMAEQVLEQNLTEDEIAALAAYLLSLK
ncbi:MAG: cytochrome c oxidase subunit II [Opitutales bacterium]